MDETPALLDMHSHWGTEDYYPVRGKAAQAQQFAIWKTHPTFWSKEKMADYFRASRVRTVLDFGFTRELPLDEVKRLHDDAIQFQQSNPDVVLGNWLQISPDEGAAGVAEIERVLSADAGFVGLAVSAVGNHRPVTDPSFVPFFEFCQAMNIPVMCFVGYTGIGANQPGGAGVILEYSHPRYIDTLAATYPGLKIVAGRSPWPWESEMIAILRHKPNVWAEFHGTSPRRLPSELKEELPRGLMRRVMFAADFPLLRYEKLVAAWRSEGYSEDLLERIFRGNAEDFLAEVGTSRR